MKQPRNGSLRTDVLSHICHESKTCVCDILALEPDESCPQHGMGEWPPRCAVCGRFLKFKNYETTLEPRP